MSAALRKALVGLAAAGALAVAAAPSASAQGPGTSLCFAVPGANVTEPPQGPLYNFERPPPAAPVPFILFNCF
jgi:hypothetical protein